MTVTVILSALANAAQVVTALVAAGASWYVLNKSRERRSKLETYLSRERANDEAPGNRGHGMRTAIHLMGHLAMTEAEVLDAAFKSKHIKSWVATDPDTNRADSLFFQYEKKAR